MIHKAKDLSPEQRAAVESLIERRILENEVISIRTTARVNKFETLPSII